MAVPANARVEPFAPFKPLLAHGDVDVTNGGYGVPPVVGGVSEENPRRLASPRNSLPANEWQQIGW